jgi:predicted transposase YbfD/YdcC
VLTSSSDSRHPRLPQAGFLFRELHALLADRRPAFRIEIARNEIDAIPRLLALLDVEGATVTLDAIGCQREVAREVTERRGDYVLAVKQNQPALHAKVKALLDEAILGGFAGMRHGHFERTDDAHGRVETRRTWVTDEVNWLGEDLLAQWRGLASVAAVESVRQDLGDPTGKVTTERLVLHQQPRKHRRQSDERRGTRTLVGGEPIALATGRQLRRRPASHPQRVRGRELQPPVPLGVEPAEERQEREDRRPRQTPQGRVGRALPVAVTYNLNMRSPWGALCHGWIYVCASERTSLRFRRSTFRQGRSLSKRSSAIPLGEVVAWACVRLLHSRGRPRLRLWSCLWWWASSRCSSRSFCRRSRRSR